MSISLPRGYFSVCHVADDVVPSTFQHKLLEKSSTWNNSKTPRGISWNLGVELRGKNKRHVAKSHLSDSRDAENLQRHVATPSSQETAVDRRSLLVGAATALTVSKTTNLLCWTNGALAAEGNSLLEADVASAAADVAVGESTNSSTDGSPVVTSQVFFDVSIDGRKLGRITVGLFGKDVPIGAARFAELAKGRLGVSYRRKEFIKIYPNYILNAGLRSFSLTGGDRDSAQFTGGETGDKIFEELETLTKQNKAFKNIPGSVSLLSFDPTIPPPNSKLVAKNGKFIMVEEAVKPPPNGTEFAIITRDAPELDSTNLVVGKILEGWEVIEEISRVQVVKENSSSPYFMTAKLIGDSRAVVAERGFNRPYSKIMITNCGIL